MTPGAMHATSDLDTQLLQLSLASLLVFLMSDKLKARSENSVDDGRCVGA